MELGVAVLKVKKAIINNMRHKLHPRFIPASTIETTHNNLHPTHSSRYLHGTKTLISSGDEISSLLNPQSSRDNQPSSKSKLTKTDTHIQKATKSLLSTQPILDPSRFATKPLNQQNPTRKLPSEHPFPPPPHLPPHNAAHHVPLKTEIPHSIMTPPKRTP
ncbi:hypothetical protein M758_UG039900 [Ceratodon purpureus]|nr:hypothetical protein M758_UG039900 [Ceratodon purpureus]